MKLYKMSLNQIFVHNIDKKRIETRRFNNYKKIITLLDSLECEECKHYISYKVTIKNNSVYAYGACRCGNLDHKTKTYEMPFDELMVLEELYTNLTKK